MSNEERINSKIWSAAGAVTLTDEQQDIRDAFKEALAGWLAVHADSAERSLIEAGMVPSILAADTLYDAVSELYVTGWHNYLRQVATP
jgi:hypothetical protein